MASAQIGDKVKVHYTGRLESGQIFDTSKNNTPLEFTIGDGSLIKGFNDAVIGMTPGDSKIEKILAKNAYGDKIDELIITVGKDILPQDMQVEVGQELELQNKTGNVVPVVITGIDDTSITFDANHPLAGKDLFFEIQLVQIG